MEDNSIEIKAVAELLGYRFFIPSYQRGYRWTEQQVKDLLNDINEFTVEKINFSNELNWYCLQPIVVKKKFDIKKGDTSFGEKLIEISNLKDETEAISRTRILLSLYEKHNYWEVIDGQQRLTTIFLILKFLDHSTQITLEYQTRNRENADSAEFLQNIITKRATEAEVNIDYCHILNAYKAIETWFENNKIVKENFKNKFTENVKIIWYETDADSIDIFTRINMGKIPLTNAELIKAIFLNSSNFKDCDLEKVRLKQLEIASEWDRMEYAFQNDSFWYFINKEENNLDTRIEFIFDLISEKDKKSDPFSTFRHFNEKFKNKNSDIISDWSVIKNYFQTFAEWFNDRELYHKIGYLITEDLTIKSLLEEKKNRSKSSFLNWLDSRIASTVEDTQIEELEYGQNNADLIKILLLHNIFTTLNSKDISLRFPFNKYKDKKNGGWSLEHIHAQNSEEISEIDDFEEWLKVIDSSILTEEILNEIKKFRNNKQKSDIQPLISKIAELFGEPNMHSIANMALLSKNDNSKLNNGLFPVKRTRVIELEKNGAFIPLATKKVFQKYFDNCTKQISKWEAEDRKAYLDDIKETLIHYLPKPNLISNEQ